MTLGEYIKRLKRQNPDRTLKIGLGNAHSWRGSYDELALEPVENTTIAAMLLDAEGALGEYQEGYKGGEFLMTADTPINIDHYGEWSDNDQIFKMLFRLMFNQN